MVVGVGIDIIKIEKIKKSIEKWGEAFINRVFDPVELKAIAPGKMYYQRLAARFAAKEAVIKAMTKQQPLALTDILVLNRESGAPYCELKRKVDVDILLSITHIEDYAVACAIAERSSDK